MNPAYVYSARTPTPLGNRAPDEAPPCADAEIEHPLGVDTGNGLGDGFLQLVVARQFGTDRLEIAGRVEVECSPSDTSGIANGAGTDSTTLSKVGPGPVRARPRLNTPVVLKKWSGMTLVGRVGRSTIRSLALTHHRNASGPQDASVPHCYFSLFGAGQSEPQDRLGAALRPQVDHDFSSERLGESRPPHPFASSARETSWRANLVVRQEVLSSFVNA